MRHGLGSGAKKSLTVIHNPCSNITKTPINTKKQHGTVLISSFVPMLQCGYFCAP
jgi:hypothetical protein